MKTILLGCAAAVVLIACRRCFETVAARKNQISHDADAQKKAIDAQHPS
jgi:hypothetical protein